MMKEASDIKDLDDFREVLRTTPLTKTPLSKKLTGIRYLLQSGTNCDLQ